MKAFLLAAGLGTRLKPFTNKHPKALAKVNGKTLLEHNIRNLQKFGIYKVVINVHHFAEQIIETLRNEDGFGSHIYISDETNQILETGGGLKKAKPFLENETSFLIMNVDILSNVNLHKMIDFHKQNQALVTLAVQQRSTSRYLLFDQDMKLNGWENVKTKERKIPNKELLSSEEQSSFLRPFAFSGIQIMNGNVFDKIKRDGSFSLIDLYLDLCVQEKIAGYNHTGDFLLDVGKPESLLQAEREVEKWNI